MRIVQFSGTSDRVVLVRDDGEVISNAVTPQQAEYLWPGLWQRYLDERGKRRTVTVRVGGRPTAVLVDEGPGYMDNRGQWVEVGDTITAEPSPSSPHAEVER